MRISVNLSTYSKRKDIVPKCIESIKNQSVKPDAIRVWYNDYKPDPIEGVIQHWNGMDYTDRGKYIWLDNIKAYGEHEIFFSTDDDFIFPTDYIEKTLEGLKKYPKHVVSWHGRRLKGRDLNYYFGHTQYNFMSTIQQDQEIDVPGSGVSAFNTKHFIPDIIQYKDQCMADLLLGLEMAKQGVKGVCLKHSSQWLRAMHTEETIYQTQSRKGGRQMQIANQIWDIATKA